MSGDSATGTERSRWVCIDLFSGLGGFSQAFEEADRWEVYSVDVEEQFDPDLRADVLDLRPADLLALVGLDREEIDVFVILASPPCTDFSMAASRYERFVDGEPQTESARESVALVYHTLGLIHALAPDYWFLENPQGYLRQVIGEPAGRVTYCQFGTEYMKPTDLWGDHPQGLTYRSCSYGDGCHAFNTDQENGGQGNARDAWRDDMGDKVRDPAERAKVPEELSRAIREAVEDAIENPPPEQQTLVTDGGTEQIEVAGHDVYPEQKSELPCPICDTEREVFYIGSRNSLTAGDQPRSYVVSGWACPECESTLEVADQDMMNGGPVTREEVIVRSEADRDD